MPPVPTVKSRLLVQGGAGSGDDGGAARGEMGFGIGVVVAEAGEVSAFGNDGAAVRHEDGAVALIAGAQRVS